MIGDDRHVPFEACFNFRDLGGYETENGGRVARGAVYRSDTLHRLTAADLELAAAIVADYHLSEFADAGVEPDVVVALRARLVER